MEQQLRRVASVDELTELSTRRHMLELGEHELRRWARHGRGLSLLLADLDRFKATNDSYGHAAGDQVLRSFAQSLREGLRDGDIAGRFGGEEFLAILPETGAATRAETISWRFVDRCCRRGLYRRGLGQ